MSVISDILGSSVTDKCSLKYAKISIFLLYYKLNPTHFEMYQFLFNTLSLNIVEVV